jgi:hypothetical protein
MNPNLDSSLETRLARTQQQNAFAGLVAQYELEDLFPESSHLILTPTLEGMDGLIQSMKGKRLFGEKPLQGYALIELNELNDVSKQALSAIKPMATADSCCIRFASFIRSSGRQNSALYKVPFAEIRGKEIPRIVQALFARGIIGKTGVLEVVCKDLSHGCLIGNYAAGPSNPNDPDQTIYEVATW